MLLPSRCCCAVSARQQQQTSCSLSANPATTYNTPQHFYTPQQLCSGSTPHPAGRHWQHVCVVAAAIHHHPATLGVWCVQHNNSTPSAPTRSSRGVSVVVAAAAGKGFGNPKKLSQSGSNKSGSKGRRKCPCGSGQSYEACCGRYIGGSALAPNPEALLRSRFSAYALQEVDYLVKTTHRQNPEHTGDAKTYARALKSTATSTEYISLDISGPVAVQELPQSYLAKQQISSSSSSSGSNGGSSSSADTSDAQPAAAAAAAAAAVSGPDGDDAFVRFSVKFRARGSSGGSENVANEVSHFKRVDGQWLYYNEVE